ncbi:T-lymphocyte activation antigen CD86-like [Protopterus annectens]|uniref:T-lymphocyte activation antigen CD86-like n=1 Tax=Protopterus annectens TaxID=7888 RepID=UPI001CF9F60E|nr:T-lymphocyte activation antigen CD86-like [Protopterus annectens]
MKSCGEVTKYSKLIVMFVLVCLTYQGRISATLQFNKVFVGGTAWLPCGFSNPKNISLDSLMIFFQKEQHGETKVVYELYKGVEKQTHQNIKYQNRTKLDLYTLTLQISGVTPEDGGIYECVVLSKQGSEHSDKLHSKEQHLNVTANFSKPVIMQSPEGRVSAGMAINLSASSTQGYPKPEDVYWRITVVNGTIKNYNANNSFIKDNATGLYNINSILTLKVTEDTKVSFIIQSSWQQTISSSEFRIYIQTIPPQAERIHLFALLGFGIIPSLFLFLFLFFWLRRMRNQNIPSASYIDSDGLSMHILELLNRRRIFTVPTATKESHLLFTV